MSKDSNGKASPVNTDGTGDYTEERQICGDAKITPNLPEVRCHWEAGSKCHCLGNGGPGSPLGNGKYCYEATNLDVKTPNARWVFSGPAAPVCTYNPGSCNWNGLGLPDRFSVTLDNPTEIHATVLTSSNSLGVKLCAPARYYP